MKTFQGTCDNQSCPPYSYSKDEDKNFQWDLQKPLVDMVSDKHTVRIGSDRRNIDWQEDKRHGRNTMGKYRQAHKEDVWVQVVVRDSVVAVVAVADYDDVAVDVADDVAVAERSKLFLVQK